MRISERMPVDAVDGPCGEVADVVVDPVLGRLTHLVVKPSGLEGRLVPVEAVGSCDDRVRLTWTTRRFQQADSVVDTRFLELTDWPHLTDGWDVGIVRMLAWPYYVADDARTTTEFDRIPQGSAEIRRESPVVSSDGEVVGHVDGLVLDAEHSITHVVLDRRHDWAHPWGHREVTVPIEAVERVETDLVRLRVAREEVGRFPTVRFRRHQE